MMSPTIQNLAFFPRGFNDVYDDFYNQKYDLDSPEEKTPDFHTHRSQTTRQDLILTRGALLKNICEGIAL